jgi:hypothetical protein
MNRFEVKTKEQIQIAGLLYGAGDLVASIETTIPVHELVAMIGFRSLDVVCSDEAPSETVMTSETDDQSQANWYQQHSQEPDETVAGQPEDSGSNGETGPLDCLPPTVRASLARSGIVTAEDAYEFLIVNESFESLKLSTKSEQALLAIVDQYKSSQSTEN